MGDRLSYGREVATLRAPIARREASAHWLGATLTTAGIALGIRALLLVITG